MSKKVNTCKKTICKLHLTRARRLSLKTRKALHKKRNSIIKKIRESKTKKSIEKWKKEKNENDEKIYFFNKHTNEKGVFDNCVSSYCNPGCKNTFYEEGTKLSKGYFKRMKITKKNDYLRKFFEWDRKRAFGKKTNVLKDDFYEKISKQKVNKLKKIGAISGCVPFYNPKSLFGGLI